MPRFLVIFAVVFAAPGALADGATLSGEVSLAPASQREPAPERNRGFVPRRPNAERPVTAYDPRPYMIVVLEGAAAESGAGGASDIEYPIEGASFTAPIRPVVAGVSFSIANRSQHAPRLYAPGDLDLIPGDPINPGSSRDVTVSTPYQAFDVRDRDTAHIEGRLVAFPHPYFSRVSDAGNFRIEDVPEGRYSLRVWYRNGWLDIDPEPVTVDEAGRITTDIDIPPVLEITSPEESPEAE